MVTWAFTLSPIGPVSALRETSIVFAAVIGRLFLSEPLTTRRLGACVVIAVGAGGLGIAREEDLGEVGACDAATKRVQPAPVFRCLGSVRLHRRRHGRD